MAYWGRDDEPMYHMDGRPANDSARREGPIKRTRTGRVPAAPNFQQVPGPRHEAASAICEMFALLTPEEKEWVLSELKGAAGARSEASDV